MKKHLLVLITLFAAASVSYAMEVDKHITVNFTERLRLTSWDNAIRLNHEDNTERTFTRHRTTLEGIYRNHERFAFHLKFANEFRYYFEPDSYDFEIDEIFLDNLFISARPFSGIPLTLSVGRQNLILDEGFIVMDGTPLDGSRGIYFNAVRADWKFGERHTLTGFVCHQDETDEWLPIVNESDQLLVEQPETGFGLYYKTPLSKADVSIYLVHKTADSGRFTREDQYVSCVGGRLAFPFGTGHRFVIEAALQDGRVELTNTSGYGAYAYLDIAPSSNDDPWYIPRLLTIGNVTLSGDDPRSRVREGWNPMFARWPKWSESHIYTQIGENSIAYWTNLLSFYGGIGFDLSSDIELNVIAHHMRAFENWSGYFGFPGGDSGSRGNLIIRHLGYTFNAHLSGHLHWENFYPGGFYFDGADNYTWFRTELMFRY